MPELFAGNAHFTARRDAWAEGEFIFGSARRSIENKYIQNTLIIDERVKHFLEGDDVEFGASLWKVHIEDGKKVIRHYIPDHRDGLADDWLLMDNTDLINNLYEKGE